LRVLIVSGGGSGVYYHRLYIPYNAISKQTDIEFLSTPTIDGITLAECRQFSAVIFSRNISHKFNPAPLFAMFKHAGCKIIMDVDDFWELTPSHVLYRYYKQTNFGQCSIDQLKQADFITCTHGLLKQEIVKLGVKKDKVFICRNAIDPNEPQFAKPFRHENKMMWQGSTTHAVDLGLLSLIEDPIQMCGYIYSDEWFEMCAKIKQPRIKDVLPAAEYMNHYNNTSVSLIPLVNNKFNRCKSELKMIEAGYAGNAVVVSDVHPYTIIARHNENCLLAKTPEDFKKYSEMLLNNSNLQIELAGKLNEEVKKRYLIDKPNETRLEILEKCK